jgi:DNA-binding SARP family transcriptional activator
MMGSGGGCLLSIEMFGPLRVSTGTGSCGPRNFGGVKPKQVLEVLLVERGRTVHKDRVADRIWGDSPPRRVGAGWADQTSDFVPFVT